MQLGGIYEIVNTVNQKRYIGSAVDFKNRWGRHRRELTQGWHHSQILQRAWKKHGADAFAFRPLMLCADPITALHWEQQYLNEFAPEYNIALSVSAPMLGRTMSVEHRAKIAAAGTGRTHTLESRAKISEAHRGKHVSEETKQKQSAVRRGKKRKPLSAETKAKIGAANAGRVVSDETKVKLSTARKLRVTTAETRAKMSASRVGRTLSAETRAKMSEAMRGREVSAAHREKISAALTGRSGHVWSDESRAKLSATKSAFYAAKRAAKCS